MVFKKSNMSYNAKIILEQFMDAISISQLKNKRKKIEA